MLPITGYVHRMSARPGDTLAFKVDCRRADRFEARLVRVRCGDPNPAGPGIRETDLSDLFRADFPGRAQDCHLGSYVRVDNDGLGDLASFSVAAMIWPTTPAKRGQGLVCRFDRARAEGFALLLDGPEGIAAVVGGGAGRLTKVATGVLLEQRRWYRVWASYDGPSRTLTAGQQAISGDASPAVVRATAVDHDLAAARSPGLYLAAAGGTPVGGHYNGKMERPRIVIPAVDPAHLAAPTLPAAAWALADWDFSIDIPGLTVFDRGPSRMHGALVNMPTRAMTGSNWTGDEPTGGMRPSNTAPSISTTTTSRLRLGDGLHASPFRRPAERRLRHAAARAGDAGT